MKVKETKEFNEVFIFMKEYFQHDNQYLFSDTIDTITNSNGKKFNSLYCLYVDVNEETPIRGVTLLKQTSSSLLQKETQHRMKCLWSSGK